MVSIDGPFLEKNLPFRLFAVTIAGVGYQVAGIDFLCRVGRGRKGGKTFDQLACPFRIITVIVEGGTDDQQVVMARPVEIRVTCLQQTIRQQAVSGRLFVLGTAFQVEVEQTACLLQHRVAVARRVLRETPEQLPAANDNRIAVFLPEQFFVPVIMFPERRFRIRSQPCFEWLRRIDGMLPATGQQKKKKKNGGKQIITHISVDI